MADTAQAAVPAETAPVDPIAAAADAFKTFDRNAPEAPERPRDESGRFVSTREPEEASEEIEAEEPEIGEAAETHEEPEETVEQPEEAQPEPAELPTSWASDKAELWNGLDPDAQAYIRQRDAEQTAATNAKFQEAANLRKAHEAEIEEAKTNRQRFAEAADILLSVVKPQRPSPSMLDQSSSDYNPDAYHRLERQFQEQVQLLTTVAQQRHEVAQLEQAESEKARAAAVAEINERALPDLIKVEPAFAKSDSPEAQDAFMGLARYALERGVPADTELSAFTNVELTLLAESRKYREMMAAKAKVQPKAPKPAAPVVKPGVATPRATVQAQRQKDALARLDKSGSIEDAAAFFLTQSRR